MKILPKKVTDYQEVSVVSTILWEPRWGGYWKRVLTRALSRVRIKVLKEKGQTLSRTKVVKGLPKEVEGYQMLQM